MITVLIVVSWDGHHPSYCAELIRACDSFSRKIYVICPGEANPLERVGGPPGLLEKVSVVSHANRAARTGFKKFTDLAADLRELRARVDSIRKATPGEPLFVFHTSLDSLFIGVRQLPLLWLGIRRLLPWPFSGLLLTHERRWPLSRARQELARLMGNSAKCGWFTKMLHSILDRLLTGVAAGIRCFYLWQKNQVLRRSRCQQIAMQDERYEDWVRIKTGKQVVAYPETTSLQIANPPPELVPRIAAKREGRVVVGLLGDLSRRKCADVLLDVIQNHDTEGFLFVLAGNCQAGSFSARHQAFLNEGIYRRSNVVFSPQRIASEGDFNAIVSSCDMIFCVYRDHLHSSNVISKAVAFRKPLLVSEGELMAKRVREYGVGSVLPEQTPEACLAALREMSSPEYRARLAKTARFEQYMEDHSFAKLQQIMHSLSRGPVIPSNNESSQR